jgi:ornithine lipid ester-linked acyl 2-hydroxylase
LITRILVNIQNKFLAWLDDYLTRSSLLGNPTFFDSSSFSWVKDLEKKWSVARRELDEILKYRDDLPNLHEISNDNFSLTQDDRWKTYFLYCFGVRNERGCQRCPETAKMVAAIPGMKTAFFSIIAPRKHLPEHRGQFKGVIRCHLGLLVPEPKEDCRLRVESEVTHWTEGKALLFDDTYRHEVWNNTDGDRVVLFLDIERPLRLPARLLNKLVIWFVGFAPMVRNGMKRQVAWEKYFDETVLNREQITNS